jgi:hypothetical protein
LTEVLKNEQTGADSHHLGVKIGQVDEAKTKLGVNVFAGTEADTQWGDFSKGIDLGDAGIVLQFTSTDPESAKDEILGLLEMGKEMLREVAQGAPVNIDAISFQGAVDGQHVNIGIKYDDPNVLMIAEQIRFLMAFMVPNDFTSRVSLEIGLAKDLNDIYKDEVENGNEKDILLHVLEGISLNIDATVTRQLLEIGRSQLVGDKSLKDVPSDLRPIVPLFFLKGANIQLDFGSNDNCPFSQLFPKVKVGFKQLLEMGKATPLDQFIGMIPPLQSLIELCENKLMANLKIAVRGPRVLATVHIKTSGVDKVWNHIKPQ